MPPRCCDREILPMSTAEGMHHIHPVLSLLEPALRASWDEALVRTQAIRNAAEAYVDRSIIRAAMNSRQGNLFQFCQRCQRLVTRSEGCNHIRCICGHHFCIICGREWLPNPDENGNYNLPCHRFYGQEDQHVLRIPPEIQARLDEEENMVPPAFAEDKGPGILCRHDAHLLYLLRLRRETNKKNGRQARCDVCGNIFREFLLQCTACSTLMCLDCRDRLWGGLLNGDDTVLDSAANQTD